MNLLVQGQVVMNHENYSICLVPSLVALSWEILTSTSFSH